MVELSRKRIWPSANNKRLDFILSNGQADALREG